jgi:hypothetical protein
MATTASAPTNLINLCRTRAAALAAADKVIADAQAAKTALQTRLNTCPPAMTTASLTFQPTNVVTFDPATGTITRNGTGDANFFAQSKDPIPVLANSFVMFTLTGPRALGYNFRIGLTETPNMSQWNNANGKNTGLFFNFFTDLKVAPGKTFAAAYRGGDGEPNFIRFGTPINPTPPTSISPSHTAINNDTSTFILHFDGTNFNLYHNGRKVHTMAPQVKPAATAKYFVWMYAKMEAQLRAFKISNLLFGNAPVADIDAFARTLPQTGGRRHSRSRSRSRATKRRRSSRSNRR